GAATEADAAKDGRRDRARVHTAMLRLLQYQSQESPTLLVLDDLHLSDEPSTALFELLAAEARRLPVLLLGLIRPKELNTATLVRLQQLGPHVEVVSLDELDESASLVLA